MASCFCFTWCNHYYMGHRASRPLGHWPRGGPLPIYKVMTLFGPWYSGTSSTGPDGSAPFDRGLQNATGGWSGGRRRVDGGGGWAYYMSSAAAAPRAVEVAVGVTVAVASEELKKGPFPSAG
ncbi:hypothetical protein Vafri_18553 [Volvox africanus]|uniref:Uncharacterized protein n=1 Tax=Volvox africanus TaxID=51714 RepID=A0A8J4BPJ4_9CHLO|nr:hypothetical protein Vafri_18553 [Volvox africanus]